MLQHIDLHHILFIDIETVPLAYRFDELDDKSKYLWDKKTRWQQERSEKGPDELYDMAGVHAEFAKVVCISAGFFAFNDGTRTFRVKSFYGDDEQSLLADFKNMLQRHFSDERSLLCAHNGKEFDFPFLARRYIINGLKLPYMLDIAGKKPWEVKHLDTMNLWKFGDFKHYTSIELLAHVMGVPTPKDDITGADVARVYYEEKDLERIKEYCEKDVITVARVMLRFKGESEVAEENLLSIKSQESGA
jgi:predicted PolB exonuclease-like 3'-5' exonuclease